MKLAHFCTETGGRTCLLAVRLAVRSMPVGRSAYPLTPNPGRYADVHVRIRPCCRVRARSPAYLPGSALRVKAPQEVVQIGAFESGPQHGFARHRCDPFGLVGQPALSGDVPCRQQAFEGG